MNKFIVFLLLGLSTTLHAQSNDLSQATVLQIQDLIALFQSSDKEAIAMKIDYPLARHYPIPSIENEKEFLVRFDQVFDADFMAQIAESDLSQWSTVGWRGTMFDNGALWLTEDGRIRVINHSLAFEESWRQKLIAQDKKRLYTSVQQFKEPIAYIISVGKIIRIDELKDSSYRMSYWNINQNLSEKPEEIIGQGTLFTEGSMANQYVVFPKNFLGEEVTVYLDDMEEEQPNAVTITYRDQMGIERVDKGYMKK